MSFNLFILSFCIFPYRLSSFSFTLTASIALYANCLVHFNISESSPLLFLPSPFLFLFPPSPSQSFSLCSRCWVIFFLQPLSFVGWVSCIFLFSLIPKSSDFPNGSGDETTPFYPLVNVICRFLVLRNINTMSPPFSFSAVVPVHGNGAREVWVYFIPELELYLPACCCLKLSIQWKSLQQKFC